MLLGIRQMERDHGIERLAVQLSKVSARFECHLIESYVEFKRRGQEVGASAVCVSDALGEQMESRNIKALEKDTDVASGLAERRIQDMARYWRSRR